MDHGVDIILREINII